MCRILTAGVWSLIVLWGISTAPAMPPVYEETTVSSPNGRYKLETKSSDGRRVFLEGCIYTCTDTKTKAVLWTRKQGQGKPAAEGQNPPVATNSSYEGGPSGIFINNAGCSVIWTSGDNLIVVGRDGKDRGKVDILDEAFSKKENEKYVHGSSAGPLWAGLSHAYFVRQGEKNLFALRPWWGNHVVLDLADAKLIKKSDSLAKVLVEHERRFVLSELKRGVETQTQWEEEEFCDSLGDVLTAAYLAGVLRVKEAVPLLRKLEDSDCCMCFTSGPCEYEAAKGKVDPSSWDTLEVRQAVHLALRRLGEIPGPYPCIRFDTVGEEFENRHRSEPPPPKNPRSKNVDQLKVGMSPEDVLTLVAGPDLVGDEGAWLYDIDAKEPYTLEVSWGKEGVTDIKRIMPPLWKTQRWDEELADN